jgi:hypothetical protein
MILFVLKKKDNFKFFTKYIQTFYNLFYP